MKIQKQKLMFVVCALLLTLGSAQVSAQNAKSPELTMLETMDGYLNISERFLNLSGEKEAAVYFAIEGIVEIYERRGHKADAAEHLTKILDSRKDNRTVRNVVRFKLRDLYNETGRSELALQQLELVIQENR